MKQYREIKEKYPDSILLFRVGDFYETFHEDATVTSKVLGIVLTRRGSGINKETKLAGFPHHSLDTYLHKLVKAGHRVAICEQLENPKLTKTIVKRGVTDLVTPGVALNDEILNQKKNNFLAAINFSKKNVGIAFLDISTGEFISSEGSFDYCLNLIENFEPKEILISKADKKLFENKNINEDYFFFVDDWMINFDTSLKKIYNHFDVKTLKGFGISDNSLGVISASMILHYLEDSHKKRLVHIKKINPINNKSFLLMDRFTISNLELVNSKFPGGKSVLDIIDKTSTPMGSRLLRRWLCFPSVDLSEIKFRHDIVEEFSKLSTTNLIEKYNSIIDIERIISKITNYKVNPRELINFKFSLLKVDEIKKELNSISKNLKILSKKFKGSNQVVQLIEKNLFDESPVNINKGNTIKNGINKSLDNFRDVFNNSKKHLQKILEREIQNTGINSLKISFNNVFGYYLEVTNAHKHKVPENWIRKQTLVNAERYITEELKEYESKILIAEEKIKEIEVIEFNKVLAKLIPHISNLQDIAKIVAYSDCLLSFSETSKAYNYSKPIIDESDNFEVIDGRHPVIEHTLEESKSYIPNDIRINKTDQQILMITGPNMSGKSAILRQTALISILAQMGSFVPAKKLKMGFLDKIFTRVGASDNISQGESTFMVEMLEAASIVNNLSNRSLILLDEIGRGTSTYDGISIAWAITQFVHDHYTKAKTLFATHYHELNMMCDKFKRVKNFNIQIKETEKDIIFLRKLIPGGSAHSFGIHVAKMAGMPSEIIKISKNILKSLEKSHRENKDIQINESSEMQLTFFDMENKNYEEFKDELGAIDTDNITPMEALVKLSELKNKITDEK
ncbi:DNA mismatch repair protein MutS [Flavobacteriales bacterium]|nr:DNA mismatch repair protein MutS [Flavobacteriales bacterium]